MRNDDADLLHVVRWCGKLGPKVSPALRLYVFYVPTTEAIVLGVANDKVFLFAGAIYQVDSTYTAVVSDFICFIRKVIAKPNCLIGIIDQRELQSHGIIA